MQVTEKGPISKALKFYRIICRKCWWAVTGPSFETVLLRTSAWIIHEESKQVCLSLPVLNCLGGLSTTHPWSPWDYRRDRGYRRFADPSRDSVIYNSSLLPRPPPFALRESIFHSPPFVGDDWSHFVLLENHVSSSKQKRNLHRDRWWMVPNKMSSTSWNNLHLLELNKHSLSLLLKNIL